MKKKIRSLFYNLINSLPAQLRWRLITQRLELRSYKSEIWRKTNAFMSQTSLLFKHWGYSRTDFKNRIICDIGAGPKLRTKFFENAKIAAIEPLGSKFISEYSWSDIKDAWRLYTQPAEKFIPDLENRCDFIVCINVLDHVYDPISVLKNAFRYLKAGGEMVLSVDLHTHTEPMHPVSLSKSGIVKMVRSLGFKIVKEEAGLPTGKKGYGKGKAYTLILRKDIRTYKVLFIPGNVYHVRMFSKVAKKLKGDVLAISLEGYGEKGRAGIERALQENGIRFKRVQDYRKEDPEFILREEKPDVVVVLNDIDPSCLYFVRGANRLGIPTLLIAEGIYFGKLSKRIGPAYFKTVLKNLLFSENVRYSLKLELRKIASILSGNPEPSTDKWGVGCSKIAVWGEYSKRCFEMKGIPPERIIVTGNPLMDELVEMKFNPGEIRKQLGVPRRAKLIVYASCNPIDINYWTEKESKEFVRLLNRIVLGLKNCFLLIRPHPTEREERYLGYLKGEDLSRTRVSKKENVYEILAAADILITDASVVGSEAAVMGKPVIVVNLTGKPYPTEQYPALLIREGVAVEVRIKDELLPTIERLLNKESHDELVKNREKFVEKYFYKIDGQSSQRVAGLIEKMVKNELP